MSKQNIRECTIQIIMDNRKNESNNDNYLEFLESLTLEDLISLAESSNEED